MTMIQKIMSAKCFPSNGNFSAGSFTRVLNSFKLDGTGVRYTVKTVELPKDSMLAKKGIDSFELCKEIDFKGDATLNMKSKGKTVARGLENIRMELSILKQLSEEQARKYVELMK